MNSREPIGAGAPSTPDATPVLGERQHAAELALRLRALVLDEQVLHVGQAEIRRHLCVGIARVPGRAGSGDAREIGGEQPGDPAS